MKLNPQSLVKKWFPILCTASHSQFFSLILFILFFNIYLFGCIRSSLWQSISSLPHLWSFVAGHRLSSCGAWALCRLSFSAACGIIPWPGIEPISPILQGRFSGKESACHCRRHRKSGLDPLGQEDPLEEEMAIMALQYSGLKNRLDREAGGLQAMGSPRVGHNWVTEHAHPFLTSGPPGKSLLHLSQLCWLISHQSSLSFNPKLSLPTLSPSSHFPLFSFFFSSLTSSLFRWVHLFQGFHCKGWFPSGSLLPKPSAWNPDPQTQFPHLSLSFS